MKMSDSVTPTPNNDAVIRIVGARQNNLKNLDLTLRHGEFTVITGPSGSGKSSLVFGTLYAEGQRRYVETFSPYARQFLDRMDRPHVDRIEGVPPAIAIDQNCTIRTSRSTVGTMTELNDHIKLCLRITRRSFAQSAVERSLSTPHKPFGTIFAKDFKKPSTAWIAVSTSRLRSPFPKVFRLRRRPLVSPHKALPTLLKRNRRQQAPFNCRE